MKYRVDMFYVLDENTTFLYDKGCRKFIAMLQNTGILLQTNEPNLAELQMMIFEVLAECSKQLELESLLPTSFQLKVYELHGINASIPGFIPNSSNPTDNVEVYFGMLSDMN
jgi:hypothetical protein